MSDLASAHQIEALRGSLGDKLSELQRRAARAKEKLSPSTYWKNPWVRLGVGLAIGLAVGHRRSQAATHEGILHSMVRVGLGAVVSSMVQRTLALPPGER